MGGNFALGLLLWCVALATTQYVQSDEPDFDIWDAEASIQNFEAQKTLYQLCQNFELTMNNDRIDCTKIQFLPRTSHNSHAIQKRDTEDVEFEGSGAGISLFSENAEADNSSQVELGKVDEDFGQKPVAANAAGEADSLNLNEKKESANEEQLLVAENPPSEADKGSETAPDNSTGEEHPSEAEPEAESDNVPEVVPEEPNNLDSETAPKADEESEKSPEPAVDTSKVEPEENTAELVKFPEVPAVETSAAKSEKVPEEPAVETSEADSEKVPEEPVVETSEAESEKVPEVPAVEISGADSEKVPEEPAVETSGAESEKVPEVPAVETSEAESETAPEEPAVETSEAESETAPEEPSEGLAPEETPEQTAPEVPAVETAEAESKKSSEDPAVEAPEAESDKSSKEPTEESDNIPEESTVETSEAKSEKMPEESASESESSSNSDSAQAPEQPAVEQPKPESPVKQETDGNTAEAKTGESPSEEGKSDNSEASVSENEPKAVPSDLNEELKEPEIIDEKQSGNAVLFKQPQTSGSSGIEGSDSDKHLASIATNEDSKTKHAEAEQPSTGESTVSRAGKDTTILIVLFVVVLVIGGAAFTHHMIKMRKAKKAKNNQNLVDDIRRSLQNLASNGKSSSPDVEQGTEMKPLIHSNSPPVMVKEYSDKNKRSGSLD